VRQEEGKLSLLPWLTGLLEMVLGIRILREEVEGWKGGNYEASLELGSGWDGYYFERMGQMYSLMIFNIGYIENLNTLSF